MSDKQAKLSANKENHGDLLKNINQDFYESGLAGIVEANEIGLEEDQALPFRPESMSVSPMINLNRMNYANERVNYLYSPTPLNTKLGLKSPGLFQNCKQEADEHLSTSQIGYDTDKYDDVMDLKEFQEDSIFTAGAMFCEDDNLLGTHTIPGKELDMHMEYPQTNINTNIGYINNSMSYNYMTDINNFNIDDKTSAGVSPNINTRFNFRGNMSNDNKFMIPASNKINITNPQDISKELAPKMSANKAPINPFGGLPGKNLTESIDDANGTRCSRGQKVLSVRVRDIVYHKKETSYKEVADTLINDSEYGRDNQGGFYGSTTNKMKSKNKKRARDEQNVKRRVYDAQNVQIAAGVLKKNGKSVLFNESAIGRNYKMEKSSQSKTFLNKEEIINKKKQQLSILCEKLIAIKGLIARNCDNKLSAQVPFPFLQIAPYPGNDTVVALEMQPNYRKLLLQSNNNMVVYGDLEVLVMLNMHNNLMNLVPKELLHNQSQFKIDDQEKLFMSRFSR